MDIVLKYNWFDEHYDMIGVIDAEEKEEDSRKKEDHKEDDENLL